MKPGRWAVGKFVRPTPGRGSLGRTLAINCCVESRRISVSSWLGARRTYRVRYSGSPSSNIRRICKRPAEFSLPSGRKILFVQRVLPFPPLGYHQLKRQSRVAPIGVYKRLGPTIIGVGVIDHPLTEFSGATVHPPGCYRGRPCILFIE